MSTHKTKLNGMTRSWRPRALQMRYLCEKNISWQTTRRFVAWQLSPSERCRGMYSVLRVKWSLPEIMKCFGQGDFIRACNLFARTRLSPEIDCVVQDLAPAVCKQCNMFCQRGFHEYRSEGTETETETEKYTLTSPLMKSSEFLAMSDVAWIVASFTVKSFLLANFVCLGL